MVIKDFADKLEKETAVASSTNPTNQPASTNNDIRTIPMRQYLDQTVVPVLLSGLTELIRERPSDALGFLAEYLLRHRDATQSAPSTEEPSQ